MFRAKAEKDEIRRVMQNIIFKKGALSTQFTAEATPIAYRASLEG
jgi:hypothetical protein